MIINSLSNILGSSKFEKLIIVSVYTLLLIALFLPFIDVTTSNKINITSYQISDTTYYSSILKGYESKVFLKILIFTLFIHIQTIILNRTSSIIVLSCLLFIYICYVIYMKTIITAGWGMPTGDYTLIGFDLSVVGSLIFIIYSFYLNIKRSQKRKSIP